jgi:hypothetical protein
VAERRASVCVNCPKNEPGDLTRFFTVPASEAIRKQLERAHLLKLHTQSDSQINVCGACLCPLRLKVWFPISFILKHMTDDVKAELQPESPRCWILDEAV